MPKLFGHISGDIIVFVSSKRTGLETGNFAVILIFIPFSTYEKTSFTELRMAFRARKVDFPETSPRGRNQVIISRRSARDELRCFRKNVAQVVAGLITALESNRQCPEFILFPSFFKVYGVRLFCWD